MAESKLRTLSIDFAVQILNLMKFLKSLSAIFFAKKNGEGRRTCRGVARRAKTEVFSSLSTVALCEGGTRRQPLFTE